MYIAFIFFPSCSKNDMMFNSNGKKGHPYLAPTLREKAKCDVSCRVLQIFFSKMSKYSLISSLMSPYHKWVVGFVNYLFSISWYDLLKLFILCILYPIGKIVLH